jgi:hypothetical protein
MDGGPLKSAIIPRSAVRRHYGKTVVPYILGRIGRAENNYAYVLSITGMMSMRMSSSGASSDAS